MNPTPSSDLRDAIYSYMLARTTSNVDSVWPDRVHREVVAVLDEITELFLDRFLSEDLDMDN